MPAAGDCGGAELLLPVSPGGLAASEELSPAAATRGLRRPLFIISAAMRDYCRNVWGGVSTPADSLHRKTHRSCGTPLPHTQPIPDGVVPVGLVGLPTTAALGMGALLPGDG